MPKLFRSILCPTDFNPNSFAALDMARELARESGGKLFLLHVVPMTIPAVGQPIAVEPLVGAEADARVRLEELAREKLAGLVPYETLVVTGDPGPEIVRVAGESAADVIVMATHGRKGFSHLLLGSVTERVVRESPLPVLTVRAHAN